jgi:WhiB family redox-sensing transcriptional regulator
MELANGDWRHRAMCRDAEDPDLWFPVGNSGPALLQISEAKVVCRRCPVASSCLTYALESGQDAGVWGGMSEDERRALKRRTLRKTDASAKARPRDESNLSTDVELYIAGALRRPGDAIRLAAVRHLLALGWSRAQIGTTLRINGSAVKKFVAQVAAEQVPVDA